DTNRIRNNHGTSRIPCGLKIRRKTVNQTLSRPKQQSGVAGSKDLLYRNRTTLLTTHAPAD
ncbi:hypothetical protein, partial [Corynebacterium belfantii]|uniref:hypothetical protein n=1 Tax=Corynebacterium belfantii TaxID=2014537 RepID=UPI001A7E9736